VWDIGGTKEHALIHQRFLTKTQIVVISSASADHVGGLEELIQNMSDVEVVKTTQHQMSEPNPHLDSDIATTEKSKTRQSIPSLLAALERVKLLTTQQAWDVAKARGCIKSRDAFRAWSRRSPEKCRELHGLLVITDPQQGKVIGYQDDQANETLEK
jgi:hypothetical protein